MIGTYEEYPETLNRLFIEDKTRGFDAKTNGIYARTITFQVTEDCCMKCTYCYQHNKKRKTYKNRLYCRCRFIYCIGTYGILIPV